MAEINIREATDADRARMREITRTAWLASYTEFFPTELIEALFDDQVKFESTERLGPTTPLGRWVAEIAGFVQGHISLNRTSDDRGIVGVLYVHPELHRLGIGRVLWNRAVEESRRCELKSVIVYTLLGASSCRFYESVRCTKFSESEFVQIGSTRQPLAGYCLDLSALA